MTVLNDILRHLQTLVAIDTCNPPRKISEDGPLVHAVTSALSGFDTEVTDLGHGSVIIDARRGDPDVLFNVHLDTVPVAEGWSVNPHATHEGGDRVVGLGVCDIKGAAAILLALAEHSEQPMRLVFTTDEEAGKSDCIRHFVSNPPNEKLAVIAEPTGARAVFEHRGILSAQTRFEGASAHASTQAVRSAVHDAAQWITACLQLPEASANRLNFGKVSGGVKPNMTAAAAEVLFGFRPQPGTDHRELLEKFLGQSNQPLADQTSIRFAGPALPVSTRGIAAAAQEKARAIMSGFKVQSGPAVDFFTEAAFFAEAGIPAVVLGSGHISEAHTADEWVSYDQLSAVYALYNTIISNPVQR